MAFRVRGADFCLPWRRTPAFRLGVVARNWLGKRPLHVGDAAKPPGVDDVLAANG